MSGVTFNHVSFAKSASAKSDRLHNLTRPDQATLTHSSGNMKKYNTLKLESLYNINIVL